MQLDALNACEPSEAERAFRQCCGSRRWAAKMTAARPFASAAALALTADVIWAALEPADWLEAFAAHPRIGERPRRPDVAGRWAAQEQSGAADAAPERLQQMNRDYEARFGYIFIVCATGKTGVEMQGILERRLHNPPDAELREAAEQQRQITQLRLEKLLT